MAPTALVLRALGLGDLITGLPALRLLRAALPAHRIVLATPSRWTPLVSLAVAADDVLDTYELAPLRNPPHGADPTIDSAVDLGVDLHGNGPASRALLEPSRPARLLAYAGGPVRWRHDEHEVARWCRLLREGLPPLGITVPDMPDPPVAGVMGPPPAGGQLAGGQLAGGQPSGGQPSGGGGCGGDVPHGVTVLHAGAAAASRRWPADRFAAVAAALTRRGHDVVVTGGPAEAALATGIAARAAVAARTDLTVRQLLELVGNARLVICGDTGVAHVASAYAVASVTLFGPVSPLRWGPPAHPRHQVLWHGDSITDPDDPSDPGDPHGTQVDRALLRITVDEVLAAADRADAAQRGQHAAQQAPEWVRAAAP